MAGTALFIHTNFDMLQKHSRITAAVETVELLWQQAFSPARLQLQAFQLREEARKITEQMETLHREKLQSYKMEIAKDAANAEMSVSHFEASIHTPAMALVRSAEDLIHTVAEILPSDGQSRECWVLDLERLKDKLRSAVHFILQTLRAFSNYHHLFNKASSWYSLVLCENFLQELVSGVNVAQQHRRIYGSIPAWRHNLSTFLKKNPPPDMEELVHLAHLSNVIPDDAVQQAGKQMSRRCMTLRNLVMSSGPVAVGHLQQALQWQYELLRGSNVNNSCADSVADRTVKDIHDGTTECNLIKREVSPSTAGIVSAEGKPPALSSFDSGIDGVGSSHLEAWGGREGVEGLSRLAGNRNSVKQGMSHPQIHKENISSVSNPENLREEGDFGSVGNSSRACIQIVPEVTKDSLNFEIKVKRSAALPNNPWLSLPVDDLESSYTVTITHNPTPQRTDLQFHHPSDPYSHRSQHEPTGTDMLSSPQSTNWILHSQSSFEDFELSPICNILSSTNTEVREKSICTTEGIPTLLWDSYDLHDQDQDAGDSLIDISQKDWDEKEQEGLMEVEKILGRADEILEEEENVLAQEAVLEALLRSEDRPICLPQWDSEDQLPMMSSGELTDAGVLGREDYLDLAESDSLIKPRSAGSARRTSGVNGHLTEDIGAFPSRLDLLTKLRTVHILDELIMEENLKIRELRCCEENPNNELLGRNPSDTNESSNVSKEREAFRLQVEKEKREVEELERSVVKEKKHRNTARKVVKCSIMSIARTENMDDLALCDELLSRGCNRAQRAQYTSVCQNEDTCKTEKIQAEVVPGVAQDFTAHDGAPQCQDVASSVADPCGSNTSTSKHLSEGLVIQPEGRVFEKELDESGENATICKPGASLTPEMRPDDGASNPGGKSFLSPVPEPRRASLPAEQETLHSTEQLNTALSSGAQHSGLVQLELQDESVPENTTAKTCHVFLNPNVKDHSNNNNNNQGTCRHTLGDLSEITTKDEEETAVVPACSLQIHLLPTMDIQALPPTDECPCQQSAPQLPPDQPQEFHPGGGDGPNETLRISGTGSPGIQMREMMDYKTPIVLDTGSGLMKAGFSDEEHPNVIFPTIIGMPKYEEIMNGYLERDVYIGHEAQHMRGVLALMHPIKNGIIRNWDEMEKIWHHTFQQLCVEPEDHPVLLTEAAMNPLENRERMVEIMFECFNVPFTYVAMQAVLVLYAAGRTTGVVFDSGDGVSHSVPVFEGYCLPHAVHRFPLAGVDVTMQLTKLLQEQGVSMRSTAELEIVREMKEKCCCVALNYEAELSRGGLSCGETHYTMPDGQIVTLCTERFRAPEILFKPELIGQDHYGIHESIFKSILSSDIDLRRCLLGNIVLSGGNTLLPGLPERLQAEIKSLVPADMGESVRITSPKDRDFSVWSGGAVLANLPTFSSAWISQEEYEEFGPQIVFRKCF
ncbi:uncharacterized protein LOC118283677 isoform X2 [Scophthalmus maximus]|nr:uncharacterized protein LOC118283677 isoform X2 [Scophthalmus maximus]